MRRCFLSGLDGSELGLELDSRESRERVLLECRGRIEGSEMVAMAFCVLSRAAAARAKMPLEDRWFNLETETVWRWEWGWAGGAAMVGDAAMTLSW